MNILGQRSEPKAHYIQMLVDSWRALQTISTSEDFNDTYDPCAGTIQHVGLKPLYVHSFVSHLSTIADSNLWAARQAGFKISVNTDVKLDHMAVFALTHDMQFKAVE